MTDKYEDASAHYGREVRKDPRLVGTTGDLYCQKIAGTSGAEVPRETSHTDVESNYFKSAQWSADGTTLLTSSADNQLRTFILPPDLLSALSPHVLRPYATHTLPSPANALAIHPAYDLSTATTALYLASPSSLPVRLISPFIPGILASYPLINPTTEAYIAPHSLLFDKYGSNGNHFFAGSESEISIFDINRNGEGPMSRMKTIPSRRKKIVGGGVGMKGIVSALALSSDGMLAAGTFARWVGLYGSGGRGDMAGVFEVYKNHEDEDGVGEGAGITKLMWSSCGRYLCVVERGSDGIGVWDVRSTGKRLSWLRGRKAKTMQRLAAEVVGNEVWAGGTDGHVRVWGDLGKVEGILEPIWTFQASSDALSSATMHPSGTVFATCSGQRHIATQEDEEEDEDLVSGSPSGRDHSISSRKICDNRLNTTALKSIKSLAPLLDRILVQRIKAETKTAGGIFLPESSVKELNEAKVLAVGPGGLDKEGKRVAPSVAPGDKVLIPQYGGSPVKVGDEEYALFRDHELLAKINE
ncbi:hypothetical protein MMC30_007838 [Trapelia coarctata]|nr:hypothetical protein [Trapelia coarctata]